MKKGKAGGAQAWLEFAQIQKEKMVKEIECMGKEIIAKIAETHGKILDTARHNTDGLLALLNIPSQGDLQQLKKKVSKIEARLEELR